MERKARIKRYPWSKGEPQGPFRKAMGSRRALTKMTFISLAHRLNLCTNFCIHLGLICALSSPLHLPCACYALSSPLKLFSPLRRHWERVSRWISLCRSPSIPTTCLNYNFSDTSLLFCPCAVKCTLLLHPPLLGLRPKTPKQGLEPSYLALSSLSPCSPNPSSLFPPFIRHICSH